MSMTTDVGLFKSMTAMKFMVMVMLVLVVMLVVIMMVMVMVSGISAMNMNRRARLQKQQIDLEGRRNTASDSALYYILLGLVKLLEYVIPTAAPAV